jgi:hypothetical protein
MRKMFYVLMIVAMLVIPASVLADEDAVEQVPRGGYMLGELFPMNITGFFPYERVDAYLYRPSTLGGWPHAVQPPVLNPEGFAGWRLIGASEQRRWSFAETEGTPLELSNQFGSWSLELMIPRDEVWYPCSFPLKWKCNFFDDETFIWDFHSPMDIEYLPGNVLGVLVDWPAGTKHWPYIDGLWGVENYGPDSDPQDTIHPLQVIVTSASGRGLEYEVVITGYEWKVSDLPFLP